MRMRKLLVIVLSLVMVLGIAVPAAARPRNDELKKILDTIQKDYDSVMTKIQKEDDKLYEALGETYETYVENSAMVQEYYDMLSNEASGLYTKLEEQSTAYYKAVVKELDMTKARDWKHAMNDLYSLVYEQIYDDIYDKIYSGYIGGSYDEIYGYILYDAPEGVEYSEYSATTSEFYNSYNMASEDFYDTLNDSRELFYNRYYDVVEAFADGETNVDDILSGKVAEKLETILAGIEKDFTDTAKKLTDEADKAAKALGSDLATFKDNYSGMEDWYALLETESTALYERTMESSIEYYKTIVDTCDMSKNKEWKRALNVLQSRIYRDAYSGFQKTIYRDKFKAIYKSCYSDFFAAVSKTAKYDDYKDARQTFYDDWYEARSGFYDNLSDAKEEFYDGCMDVYEAFLDDDTDIDAIFAE